MSLEVILETKKDVNEKSHETRPKCVERFYQVINPVSAGRDERGEVSH